MSLLTEVKAVFDALGIPVETGTFSDPPPDRYAVITPMADVYGLFADNRALFETQEARLSLFDKGAYTSFKNAVVKALLAVGLNITGRIYLGCEGDTGYHHYAIDVAKEYALEE